MATCYVLTQMPESNLEEEHLIKYNARRQPEAQSNQDPLALPTLFMTFCLRLMFHTLFSAKN